MQNIQNKVRYWFAIVMLTIMASLFIRHFLVPLQIEDDKAIRPLREECSKIKDCRSVSVKARYKNDKWGYEPAVVVTLSSKSKLTLSEIGKSFEKPMADRFAAMNRFQKWTQQNHDYEVKYEK